MFSRSPAISLAARAKARSAFDPRIEGRVDEVIETEVDDDLEGVELRGSRPTKRAATASLVVPRA